MGKKYKPDYMLWDALKEVNTMGAGHASTSLSALTEKKVEIKLTKGGFLPINKIPRYLGLKNELVTGIYIRVRGDLVGSPVLLFPRNYALRLADILKGERIGTTRVLNSGDRSILGEMGGIVMLSYMNVLGDFLDMNLRFSVPSVAFDMAGSIIRFILVTIPGKTSHALLLRTDFFCGKGKIGGRFILLLDKKSTELMLDKLMKKYYPAKTHSFKMPWI